jgi:hypothetical protein
MRILKISSEKKTAALKAIIFAMASFFGIGWYRPSSALKP